VTTGGERGDEQVPCGVACRELNGTEIREFWGATCMTDFWTWARQQGPCLFLAHNSQAYDLYLLLKTVQFDLTEEDRPRPMTQGNKIQSLSVGNVKFQDSLLHMKGSLAEMPNKYGFATLNGKPIQKGYCPYKWYNSFERLNGPPQAVPGVEWFPSKVHEEPGFQAWHASFLQEGEEAAGSSKLLLWDPKEEMRVYLHQDVNILGEACKRHRELFVETSANPDKELPGLDPFCGKIVTLASACYKTFRQNFYDHNALSQYKLPQWVEQKLRQGPAGGNCASLRARTKVSFEMALQGRVIKYVDFTSLYPYVMLKYPMPYGKPEIQYFSPPKQPDDDGLLKYLREELFGFITCDFEAPKDLFNPVILKTGPDGILRDTLEPIRGITVSSLELQLALCKGYVVSNIQYLFKFQSTMDFYREYLSRFVRIKVESEDYSNLNEEELETFICIYKQEFGIELRKEKLREPANPGMKAVGKATIVYIHGRWGMRLDRETSKYVTPGEYDTLKRRQHNEELTIKEFTALNEQLGFAKFTACEEPNASLPEGAYDVNAAVSLFVSSAGRVMLYEALEMCGMRVLYYDTDSLFYVYDPAGKNPKIGYHGPHAPDKYKGHPSFVVLGTFTDECHGLPILSLCAPRSKQYAFKAPTMEQCLGLNQSEQYIKHHGLIDLTNKDVLKSIHKGTKVVCKGINQTQESLAYLNFETMCALVEDNEEGLSEGGYDRDDKTGQLRLKVPVEEWVRGGHGRGSLATADAIYIKQSTKHQSATNIKRCRESYRHPLSAYLLTYPEGHQDLQPETKDDYACVLARDGREQRAERKRKRIVENEENLPKRAKSLLYNHGTAATLQT